MVDPQTLTWHSSWKKCQPHWHCCRRSSTNTALSSSSVRHLCSGFTATELQRSGSRRGAAVRLCIRETSQNLGPAAAGKPSMQMTRRCWTASHLACMPGFRRLPPKQLHNVLESRHDRRAHPPASYLSASTGGHIRRHALGSSTHAPYRAYIGSGRWLCSFAACWIRSPARPAAVYL